MADYDSDSSADSSGDIRTQVLLGYASATPTSDDFSQLGGHPTWLDPQTPPSAALAKCKVCNNLMSLMLQLNGDLPEQFPGHERRLYLWACRRKTCRRKEGSVRGFRGVRAAAGTERKVDVVEEKQEEQEVPQEEKKRMGESLFGVKPSTGAGANPFASGNPFASNGSSSNSNNPFAGTSSLAAKPPQKPATQEAKEEATLPETFAQKAKISGPSPTTTTQPTPQSEPWPANSAFPKPFPSQHLDAGAEYIDPTPTVAPTNVRLDTEGGGMDMKDAFESSMDKTFQKFADRLAQNPEQVLRYEYAGQPLLYSKTDAVGQRFGDAAASKVTSGKGVPPCGKCGAKRVFELQVTPQLIMELEREEVGLDGMEWGTVLLGTCTRDCGAEGEKGVGFVEEWVGVQWEEVASHKRPT